ncbi:hypothetical protein M9Y10_028365 [Tritrichomonas musculus]|uniref:Myb-like DNA-binding domain containing protein n=1 Tax=Tritrichomonas musculus TaxID=1915356 RepID=A0ABR2GIK6_9EUKA
MNQNQQNSIFKEYAFSYIENQLNLPTASIPIEILKAIEDFIDDKIEYKQSLNIFSNFEISPNIISTINKIKNVNELSLIDTESEFNRKKRKLWTEIEDIRLVAGVIRYGNTNWKIISDFVGNGRTRVQCCQRWQRTLNPSISKFFWTPEEENNLIDLVHKYGNQSWSKIASQLGNRSDVQCRYHFVQMCKQSCVGVNLNSIENNVSILANMISDQNQIQINTISTDFQNKQPDLSHQMSCDNTFHNSGQFQSFNSIPDLSHQMSYDNTFHNSGQFQSFNSIPDLSHQMSYDNTFHNSGQFQSFNSDESYDSIDDQILSLKSTIEEQSAEIDSLSAQNSQLNKQISILNLNNRRFQKILRDNKNHYNLIIRNKDRKINNLEQIMDKINNKANWQQDKEIIQPHDITGEFIKQLIENYNLKPNGRRFSQMFYDLSYVMYLHSYVTYKILRSVLPLPCEQSLRKKYNNKLHSTKENLLNSGQIKILLSEFRTELDSSKDIYATLAYDSATVDAENSRDNNLFVFNLQPLDGTVQSQILQITQNATGRTDEQIRQIINNIIEEGEKQNIHFLFVASDGESGTNKIHSDFFAFVESLNTTNFDEIIEALKSYKHFFPSSDWFHIIKDLRGRFSKNNIIMFPSAPVFNAVQVNEILMLPEIVIKAQGQASMRDDLALYLFRSQNLSVLAENNEFCSFSFLFPYVLVNIAIQSDNLNTDSRYQLIKLAFNVILLLRQNAKGVRSRTNKKSPCVNVRFAEEISCKRTLNTLLVLGFAMKFFNQNLEISRLFTHTVEYIFGYMRRLTYGKDKDTVAINALAKQQISKSILRKYNIESLFIRGRVNLDDDNIENFKRNWTLDIKGIIFDQIPQELIELMHDEINYNSTETSKLVNFINQYTESKVPSINSRKRIGDSIRSRQKAYK